MKLDHTISVWIRETFPTESIRRVLGRWNRGEVFFVLILPVLIFWSPEFTPFGWALGYVCLVAFLNDRMVLVLKRTILRGRPLVSVAGKKDDTNPDMKHSFPSAHSANSMVVVLLLILAFSLHPWILIFTLASGIGRLLSLHHFFSDVLGGWVVGGVNAILASLVWVFFIRPIL